MILHFAHDGRDYVLTTDNASSSHGIPVLLVDGELQDGLVIYHSAASAGMEVLDAPSEDPINEL